MPVIEQNFIFPTDLDPEVFGEKTKGGKKYITVTVGAEGAGTDTNEVQFGTETKTVKAQIEYETCTLVFTELLNHNRNGKRMFVCTDVIQDGNSLIEETTEVGGGSSYSEGEIPPLPGGSSDDTFDEERSFITAAGNRFEPYSEFIIDASQYKGPLPLQIIVSPTSGVWDAYAESGVEIEKEDGGLILRITDINQPVTVRSDGPNSDSVMLKIDGEFREIHFNS